jgi:Ca2+-binding EF-hand superfamily protein
MEMLEALYNELQKQNALYDNPGINFEDFKKILAKKKKDEDIESDLIDAFKFLYSCRKPPIGDEETPEGKE